MTRINDTKKVAADLKARKVAHVSPGHCSADHNVGQVFEEAFAAGYVASKPGRRVMPTLPGP